MAAARFRPQGVEQFFGVLGAQESALVHRFGHLSRRLAAVHANDVQDALLLLQPSVQLLA